MAINKAMRLALKALSYPDLEETYKLQRAVIGTVKSPHLLKPIYKKWDRKVVCNGREVPVRIYPCKEATKGRLILFFHGGVWAAESVDTYNNVCKTMAKQLKSRIISVEYSLAPENPFPTGLEDCYSVAKNLLLHTDEFGVEPQDITLIGDSAGGNLAAAVSLMARDRQEFQIARQVLLYPVTYNDHSAASPFPSVQENGTGYLLTAKRMCEYLTLYKSCEDDLQNPYFAPLLEKNLANQPKTLIITAEYDPLRDEGEAYGNALKDAGNDVSIYRMRDALHGFFSLGYGFEQVRKAYSLIDEFLKEC